MQSGLQPMLGVGCGVRQDQPQAWAGLAEMMATLKQETAASVDI